jgi:hypothetical protein
MHEVQVDDQRLRLRCNATEQESPQLWRGTGTQDADGRHDDNLVGDGHTDMQYWARGHWFCPLVCVRPPHSYRYPTWLHPNRVAHLESTQPEISRGRDEVAFARRPDASVQSPGRRTGQLEAAIEARLGVIPVIGGAGERSQTAEALEQIVRQDAENEQRIWRRLSPTRSASSSNSAHVMEACLAFLGRMASGAHPSEKEDPWPTPV